MNKETYERLYMDVTQFDAEDIITTSGETPTPTRPPLNPGDNEMPFIP
ncbi:MAG: hypothetical protein IJV48_06255 [Ruminococcus sp.]|nr:hypothetical protein [Ruminococcus sp.]